MPKTAADTLVEILIAWGVDTIFGLPGDGINGIMEALRQRQDQIRFIGVRHEEAAAFAAVGYAKFSGKLGVCLATSGPGGIHLLNGLYDAKLDGVPVLAITGMQYHDLIGTFYQQDVDTDRLFNDMAVYTERIMSPAHVENVLDTAVRMALSRRGVAHLSFASDLQIEPMEEAKFSPMDVPHHTSRDWRVPVVIPVEADLRQAAEVLNAAKRPVIIAGSGARGAAAELRQVAETLGATIAKAYLGKDVFPDDDPLCTGGMGVWGTTPTELAFEKCDAVLMVGTSFPYFAYLPKPEGRRVVQIDRAADRIGIRMPTEVGLVGDARATLAALIPMLQRNEDRSFLEEVQAKGEEWRETLRAREAEDVEPIRGPRLAAVLNRHMADDAIVCADSGQNVFWLARHMEAKGQRRFSGSGTLASMASALPYAIGAQAAFPERQVVAFAGDGGMAMLMAELSSCVRSKLPIKAFVANNRALNMIRWEQMMYNGNPEYAIDLEDIDFAKVAEACGATGIRVEAGADLEAAVARAFSTPGPVLVDVLVDPLEPIMPGKLKPELAKHYAEALEKGQPHRGVIERNLLRSAEEISQENAKTLREALPGGPDTP